MTFWTSEYLIEKLDELEDEDLLKEMAEDGHSVSEEDEKAAKLILSLIGRSLDSPLPAKLGGAMRLLRGDRSTLEGWIDEFLCRDFLSYIPEIVQRARRIEPFLVDEMPQLKVASLWKESARSYVYGHFQASVALSRATIEQALKAAFASKGVPLPEEAPLAVLFSGARQYRVLPDDVLTKADSVRRAANRVLHDETTNSGGALDVLAKAREVLEALYGR